MSYHSDIVPVKFARLFTRREMNVWLYSFYLLRRVACTTAITGCHVTTTPPTFFIIFIFMTLIIQQQCRMDKERKRLQKSHDSRCHSTSLLYDRFYIVGRGSIQNVPSSSLGSLSCDIPVNIIYIFINSRVTRQVFNRARSSKFLYGLTYKLEVDIEIESYMIRRVQKWWRCRWFFVYFGWEILILLVME